jgi:hypothetical protein
MRILNRASANPPPIGSDQMNEDLGAISADLRRLYAEVDSDIARRREKRSRPLDDVTRSFPGGRL